MNTNKQSYCQPNRLRTLIAAAMLLLVTSQAAAKVFLVGPTRAIKQIQVAVGLANSGDLILVDPGNYGAVTVAAKGITIASARSGRFVTPRIIILATPAGQQVTILGFEILAAAANAPHVRVTSCSGSVRLRNGRVRTGNLPGVAARAVIEVVSSPSVFFEDVSVLPIDMTSSGWTTNGVVVPNRGVDRGISAILVQSSKVMLTTCTMRGFDNSEVTGPNRWGGNAIRTIGDASVRVCAFGTYAGGSAPEFGGSCILELGHSSPGSALMSYGLSQGFQPGNGTNPGGMYAINHDRGLAGVGILRAVPLTPRRRYAQVDAAARVAPGGSLTFSVTAPATPRPYALVIGPSLFGVAPTPTAHDVQALNYASGSMFVLAAGMLPTLPVTMNVSAGTPRGVQAAAQAMVWAPAGQAEPVSFSTTTVFVVD